MSGAGRNRRDFLLGASLAGAGLAFADCRTGGVKLGGAGRNVLRDDTAACGRIFPNFTPNVRPKEK